MAVADASHFDGLISFLKQKRENITFHDIISLAEVAAQSLQGFFQAMDAKVYRELREIAGYIDSDAHRDRRAAGQRPEEHPHPVGRRGARRHRGGDRDGDQHHHGMRRGADGRGRERSGRLQGAGRREDDDHLRSLLVPGHHRPAHRQGGRDAAAHRAARRALRRCHAGEGSRRLHQRRRNARAPSARRNSCSTARSSPAKASTSPMVDEMFP